MNGKRILIVDDELHTREICADFLSEDEHEIEIAENGEAALEILSQKAFHILLTDIQMPVMDGITLLKESKKRYPETEVILMTAYGGLPSAIEAIRLGAYDYLTKPFTRDFLLHTIYRCLEKIELQRKLKESQLKLIEQEKLAALGSISAWLSHRMRNSLSIISMCAHYLDEKVMPVLKNGSGNSASDCALNVGRDDFKEVLAAIIEKVKVVDKMTSDFISYSRSYELQKCPENINDIIEEVMESLSVQIQIQKVQLIKQLNSNLPEISCDFHILREIFENIILNALQAIGTQENQFLIIKTEVVSSTVIDQLLLPAETSATETKQAKSKGNKVMVSISNTGSAILPENKEKIFTPFFTTKENGSGLGLAIAKKFVDLHGGKIFAENEEWDGRQVTAIKIALPVQ